MSFIDELKKRKVLRVATVYVVVAWVAIQAASIALPSFGAPDWAMRVLMLLFALGFPLTLLLTWALELTPEGVKLTPNPVGNKRMAGVVAVLAALALGWFFIGKPGMRSGEAVAGERSIAVLPFVNMSGDKANEYFSDGLAETTLDMLAQVKDLKVIARTSSFAFKGKATDMREIGRALGAAHLLEGSVQQSGDTVRITAQLIRSSDGTHLWSKRYDRQLTDVFKIQDEIATEVVKALQIALPAAEQKQLLRKRTDNVAAYKEYLKGNALLVGRKVADMRRALAHFEQAIKLDSGYARAYAAASSALALIDNYASITPEEERRQKLYIDRALELAPNLGEAHIAHAVMLEKQRKLPEAAAAFRRGVEFAPGYATGWQWYAEFLMYEHGDIGGALPMFERALVLDPLSPIIRNNHAFALLVAGRTDEALARNARLLVDRPDFAPAHSLRADTLQLRGDLVGGLRALKTVDEHDPVAGSGHMLRCDYMARFGAVTEAADCLDRFAALFPDQDDKVIEARIELMQLVGNVAGALALLSAQDHPDPWQRADLLILNRRAGEALPILRSLVPELFAQPPEMASPFIGDAIMVGTALLQTGARQQGRALLQEALRTSRGRPYANPVLGRGWWDVFAQVQLENVPGACRVLKEAVDSGYFLDIPQLDATPLMEPLRADPCYQRILAPARAKAAAQVAAARKAGLL